MVVSLSPGQLLSAMETYTARKHVVMRKGQPETDNLKQSTYGQLWDLSVLGMIYLLDTHVIANKNTLEQDDLI